MRQVRVEELQMYPTYRLNELLKLLWLERGEVEQLAATMVLDYLLDTWLEQVGQLGY